jgi:pimeloyl-ACP methyl ester carboxylesterase/DNA-binding winged helix-turn-helix (wHTH) protein
VPVHISPDLRRPSLRPAPGLRYHRPVLYRFEDFELDLDLFELRKAGQPRPIEPQVFDVLAFLVQNQGRVVTKDELIAQVWPEGFISEAALTSRVMSARKAVDDNGNDQRLIKTVHGRGYRFAGDVQAVQDADRSAPPLAPAPPPLPPDEPEPIPAPRIQYTITKDGVSIAYAVAGSGPPLVRSLGWFTHLELEWRWPKGRRLWERLARNHTLVRYDARSMGLSEPAGDINLQTHLLDLEAVIEATGFEKVALLGMSRGVQEATYYAARHPERVSHLIAYGGGPVPPATEEREEWRRARQIRAEIVRHGWGTDTPAYRLFFTHMFLGNSATAEDIAYFTEMQRMSTTPERAAKYMAENPVGEDYEEVAASVRVPTLVVHRRGDHLVPFSRTRKLASLIPGARLAVLEGDNHWLLLDDPGAPEFVRLIESFIRGDPK